MMFILGILTCLLAAMLGVLVLLYQKLDRLTIVATNQQAQDYVEAAQTPKTRNRIFAAQATKTDKAGRAVQNQEQLVDLSDIDADVGIAALESYAEEL